MIHTFLSKTDRSFVGRGSRSLPHTSVDSFPLLLHTSLEQCVARRRDNGFTVREFLASARDLAFRLPVKRHVINLCKDRYHFLIGFAAALISRQISLLPNCYASEAFAQLKKAGLPHKLVMVGQPGWHCEPIYAEVARQGLTSDVLFTGYVPFEDLPAL